MRQKKVAVIFDLDGVLTDTAELHYQSWQWLMDEMEIPFDRRKNEALRGLSRPESLETILGDRSSLRRSRRPSSRGGRTRTTCPAWSG
jgi:beta-phosphoglucomutase-like phosphatase (HAD superfamily)